MRGFSEAVLQLAEQFVADSPSNILPDGLSSGLDDGLEFAKARPGDSPTSFYSAIRDIGHVQNTPMQRFYHKLLFQCAMWLGNAEHAVRQMVDAP